MSLTNKMAKKLSRLIIAGKERLKLYSWEEAAQKTEMVYQKVLNDFLK